MAEETKLTLKVGIIASLVAAIVMFILQTLWGHQTDISILKTNQAVVMRTIDSLQEVPSTLASIQVMLINNKDEHAIIMKRLEKK